MSKIHSSCTLDGCSSALMRGMARLRTVRSIAYTSAARRSTASPIHSRLVARAGISVIWFMLLQTAARSQAHRNPGASRYAWNDIPTLHGRLDRWGNTTLWLYHASPPPGLRSHVRRAGGPPPPRHRAPRDRRRGGGGGAGQPLSHELRGGAEAHRGPRAG